MKTILKFYLFCGSLMISSNAWSGGDEFDYPKTPPTQTPTIPAAYQLNNEDSSLGKRGERPNSKKEKDNTQPAKKRRTSKPCLSEDKIQEMAETAVNGGLILFGHQYPSKLVVARGFWVSPDYGLLSRYFPSATPSMADKKKIIKRAKQIFSDRNSGIESGDLSAKNAQQSLLMKEIEESIKRNHTESIQRIMLDILSRSDEIGVFNPSVEPNWIKKLGFCEKYPDLKRHTFHNYVAKLRGCIDEAKRKLEIPHQ